MLAVAPHRHRSSPASAKATSRKRTEPPHTNFVRVCENKLFAPQQAASHPSTTSSPPPPPPPPQPSDLPRLVARYFSRPFPHVRINVTLYCCCKNSIYFHYLIRARRAIYELFFTYAPKSLSSFPCRLGDSNGNDKIYNLCVFIKNIELRSAAPQPFLFKPTPRPHIAYAFISLITKVNTSSHVIPKHTLIITSATHVISLNIK